MTLDNEFNARTRWSLNFGYYAGYASVLFTKDGELWNAGWFDGSKPGKQAHLARLLLSVYHRRVST